MQQPSMNVTLDLSWKKHVPLFLLAIYALSAHIYLSSQLSAADAHILELEGNPIGRFVEYLDEAYPPMLRFLD